MSCRRDWPTLADQAPVGDDWIHELKHDGFRTMLVADGRRSSSR
jgi:ATP-dependent DNA ligase